LCVKANLTHVNAGNIDNAELVTYNAGNSDTADKGSDREGMPLQARLKRLKRVHNGTAVPAPGPATASATPAREQGGSSRHAAQHIKLKGLSKQDQRR